MGSELPWPGHKQILSQRRGPWDISQRRSDPWPQSSAPFLPPQPRSGSVAGRRPGLPLYLGFPPCPCLELSLVLLSKPPPALCCLQARG